MRSFYYYFFIIAILFGINFFIAFCKRENFTSYFNTINMHNTENIKCNDSEQFFAIKFDCDNNTKALELFKLEVKHYKNKTNQNYTNITTNTLSQNVEFFQNHKELELNDWDNSFCFENTNETIRGSHGGEFNYYEISIVSKIEDETHYTEIDNFLKNDDCKVELYFADIKMDFNSYSKPFETFINEFFLQLNPDFIVNMNTFFIYQHFEDENSLFHQIYKKKSKNTVFSRNEQYYLYKGNNKTKENYKYYAKIYIRADTKKIEIKRKYPNLMEFYADTFSFWVAIFYLLYLLFYIFNNFYASLSLDKNLFFFRGVENKYFNISENREKIESLIKLTNNLLNRNNNHQKTVRQFPNRHNERALHMLEQHSTDEQLRDIDDANNNNIIHNIRKNEEENNDSIKYSFNIFEFICMKLCKCCISKKLKRKKKLLTEANIFIHKKLDIIFYIRNMIFLDMLNKIILGDEKKGINKLLITPIIFGKEKEEEIEENYYGHYCEDDFNNYHNEILELNESQIMGKAEKKIISLSNEKLKKMSVLN